MAAAQLTPAAAHRVLSRAGFGPRVGEAAMLARRGLPDWVDRQLALPAEDAAVEAQLAALRLPIRYPASEDWPAVDETRPLTRLAASPAELFALLPTQEAKLPPAEVDRVRIELSLATLLRRTAAEAQLRERVVEFWHDHFSVFAFASNQIRLTLPEHDRRVRAEALGNFRVLLEAMASSPAMLFYLSNQSSRAGAPNENFARELLELHTLGRAAYFGTARSAREVPRDAAGRPAGYVDADVWEAARAFCGWSVAQGQQVDGATRLPRSGGFTFVAAWHDPYQKRFLGSELDPFAGGMAHGRAVLDRLAAHPATARLICGKLVRHLLGVPAPAVAARAILAFEHHAERPDQLAQVVRAILAGPEIAAPAAGRMRRPLDAVAAAVRAFDLPFNPQPGLLGQLAAAGQLPFGWPAPDGQPLDAVHYAAAGALRARWQMLAGLPRPSAPVCESLAGQPLDRVLAELAGRALGPGAVDDVAARIAGVWQAAGRSDRPGPAEVAELAGWVLLAPGFQQV